MKKNKKICYLADSSSTHTKKFCDYFSKLGYEIYVISLNAGDIDNAIVYNLNYEVKKHKNEKTIKKIGYLKSIGNIKKIVKDINPDILHAHFASSYGFLGSLVKFKPYVISVWGSDIYEFPKKSFINKFVLEYNLNKADYILSTSYAMAKETRLYTNKDIKVTPFGVDVDFFKPKKYKSKDKNEFIIGTVKTLEKRYGIEYLIKAFKHVKELKKDMNVKLVIGGDGSEKDRLLNLCKKFNIENDVEFIGYVKQDNIVEVFNSFDIAVFPSLKESFGVAAVEAQSCGIPVIATNVGGLPEAVNSGESAILVESRDELSLGNAIIDLINNKERLYHMGIKGREFVCKNLNVDNNFEEIEKLYTKIIK